jgi:hypothetical protein
MRLWGEEYPSLNQNNDLNSLSQYRRGLASAARREMFFSANPIVAKNDN